ncbi:HNH endonuclease signature motif containing protein [Nakamurella deserti]|uniref:HNH endonuclease signature motif containing protein n=1 Tax=Nakamurella deserti TaxID=2164074 RepID=UPI000DBE7676|nr:HNH endonuclease signature motif containing protein [Nakamurella deserti]
MFERTGFATAEDGHAVLSEVCAGTEELIHGEFAKLLDEDFFAVGRRLETLARLVWAAQVAWTDEADQRGLAAARSCSSTKSLLQAALHIPARDASARLRAARAIHAQDLPSGGETPAALPVLGAAVTSGLIDRDAAATVIGTMHRLPPAVDADTRSEAEQALVAHALDLDPDQFRRVAQHLAEALNPDGTLDDRDPSSHVMFTIGARSSSTGLTSINGKLDDLSVEVLRSAIEGLAAPRPGADGVKDARPAATRRAQALVEVVRLAMTHATLPTHSGERPHVTVTLHWDVLRRQIGSAVTAGGTTLTPAAARRLLCDATVIPAVLGGDGEVLDIGRSARTFPRAVRRAITLRDGGCAFPGCDRPPAFTDVHHIRWWVRDLGDTSYRNGCLLCQYHHSEVHKNEWRVQISDDGFPEFIPPAWVDPARSPRRNTVHSLAPGT